MKKNKKILFLLHLPPPVHGASLVGELIKNSKIINDSFETRYINLLISRTVNESGKTKLLKLGRFFITWLKLLINLILEKPNLCYFALTSNGNGFYKDVTLVFLLKLFRVKTVLHLHSKGVKRKQSNRLNYFLYQYVFKGNNVILLSKYLYDDIETFVSMEQVYICPNGVEDFRKNSVIKLEKKSEPVKILFLSNLIESKGVFILIQACEILLRKGYNFSCDFVGGEGDVSASQFKEDVEKRGLFQSVKYIGRKYGGDKNEIYKNADIFVLPTFYNNECFPLVLLEAMQFQLPTISTIEGGIKDIVEDNVTGILVKRNNVIDLADKLEVLMNNDSLRIQMGKAGRRKYENEFTLQAFETKLQGILEELLLKEIES